MGKRSKIERGWSPEALADSYKSMWRNSPGLRLRLYTGIAILAFGVIWSLFT